MNSSSLFLKTKPWEKDKYEVTRKSVRNHPRRNPHLNISSCRAVYDTDIDYEKTYWKLGDVVKFGRAYYDYEVRNNWRSWYFKKEDIDAYIKENCVRREKIPLYAEEQYAIILSRYKWIKYKWHGIYKDYGSVIMMLSGSMAGHIRRFYACSPWQRIDTFPYQQQDLTELFQGTTVGSNEKNFLERLMRKFGNEN